MKLRSYMLANEITPLALADLLGVTRQYVYLLMTGRRTPSIHVANRITEWSNGAVAADDLEVWQ